MTNILSVLCIVLILRCSLLMCSIHTIFSLFTFKIFLFLFMYLMLLVGKTKLIIILEHISLFQASLPVAKLTFSSSFPWPTLNYMTTFGIVHKTHHCFCDSLFYLLCPDNILHLIRL